MTGGASKEQQRHYPRDTSGKKPATGSIPDGDWLSVQDEENPKNQAHTARSGAERRSGAEPPAKTPPATPPPPLPFGGPRHTLEPDQREMPERRHRAALDHAY